MITWKEDLPFYEVLSSCISYWVVIPPWMQFLRELKHVKKGCQSIYPSDAQQNKVIADKKGTDDNITKNRQEEDQERTCLWWSLWVRLSSHELHDLIASAFFLIVMSVSCVSCTVLVLVWLQSQTHSLYCPFSYFMKYHEGSWDNIFRPLVRHERVQMLVLETILSNEFDFG